MSPDNEAGLHDFRRDRFQQLKASLATSRRPAAKPRHTLRPADLVAAAFLETEADIDAFLSTLHAELKAALDRGQRIQIR